jgi:iron-sulfur cluster assembly protein
LLSLKKSDDGNLYIRMGVKSGGCSGMSYVMDIIKPEEVTEEDHIEMYDDVKCVVDPKSLLYIYGLKLGYYKIFLNNTYNFIIMLLKKDYSDELIGGGFKFSNPNAETSW